MRLLYLAVIAAAAGGVYLTIVPKDWEWHQYAAGGAIAVAVFLLLATIFKGRKPKAK
jgi:hypothetical protein